jgi:hypothetical protein
VTFAGDVVIGSSGGQIQIDGNGGADSATFAGNLAGSSGGALNVNVDGASTATVNGNITNNGNLTKTGSGTLALGATTTVAAPTINANGGTLDVSAKAALSLGSGKTLAGTATVLGNVSAGNGSTVRVGAVGMPQVDVYTYIDAKHGGNTTLADGSALVPGTNPQWQERTGLGNESQLYQGGSDTANPNEAPVLKTTLSGLTPGNSYNVYVNYWDATGSSWRILAGTSEGSLTLFDSPDDAVVDATDGANLNNLTYDTAPLITEGNRTMWGGSLGTLVANGSGNIEVFVDDTGTADGDDRTWYDGVSISTGATTAVSQAFTVDGDLTLGAGSTLALDISTPSVLDTLNITGNLTAGGTLQVALDGSAPAPQLGDQFNILDFGTFSGSFSSFSLPALGSGLAWDTANLLGNGGILEVINALLQGDLDGDGFVGITDLNIVLSAWNTNVNPGVWALGDPSGDGFVGIEDLNAVLGNWNAGAPPATRASIPEPASAALLGLGAAAMFRRQR